MIGVHREAAFEAAIEAALLASGWHQGDPGHYDPDLALDTAELTVFIGATQGEQWEKRLAYYGGDVTEAQRSFNQLVADQIDKRGALDVLRHGVKDRGLSFRLAYFRPAHTIAADALEQYRANRLSVTRQLRYSNAGTLDLALFVNGIPVATAELKNPLTGQTVEDAKRQYRRDRDPKETLFARRTLVHFAVDPELVFITTRLAGDRTRFLPFNTGSDGPGRPGGAGNPAPRYGGYRTSYLWEEIWQPDAWLDLIRRFLHLDNPEGRRGRAQPDPHKLPMIFPRYHQWHAVRSLTDHAARHGSGHNYLVMHSAGSGKSNTIAWLAHRLSSLHTPDEVAAIDPAARAAGLGPNQPVFDKVIVITDRVVLDRQLQDTIYQFEHVSGVVQKIDEHSSQLAAALRSETAKVVVTTLWKFPYVLDQVSELRGKRFAVVIDEAHSSQSGDSAAALKRVLLKLGSDDIDADGDPLTASALARGRHDTLSYFAFTATPKSKTLELFGTPGPSGKPEPFHVYSMRQAIDEGFILDPLRNYLTYQAYWKLANSNRDDPEVDPRKAGAQLAKRVSLHPTNMAKHAEIIVEHFLKHTASRLGGRAKAMVVTSSREQAARLFHALRDYIRMQQYPDPGVLVAFSGALNLDGIEITEAQLNGFGEKELPARFGYTAADDTQRPPRYDREYRLLVVADKYQTGFDQPLLTTMYVAKVLKSVAAVQTLSRLNRTHPLKSQGDVFVLDFVNAAADIQGAFQPYYESTITEPTDPNLLYTSQQRVMGYQLLVESELRAFTEAYFAADAAATNETAWRRGHAALYRFTAPAADRYVALQADDPEAADGFRDALRAFVRLYGFLSQVITWHDEDLERLYLYGRHLLNRLPAREDPSVDIGEVDLTHLRITRTGEHDLALTPEGPQSLPGYAGDGAGPRHEPDKVPLSELIDAFNDRYGLGLTDTDKIWYEQQISAAAADGTVRSAALVNDEENFGLVFDRRFDDVVMARHDDNGKLLARYFDDNSFRSRLTDLARREAYRMIRREHNLT